MEDFYNFTSEGDLLTNYSTPYYLLPDATASYPGIYQEPQIPGEQEFEEVWTEEQQRQQEQTIYFAFITNGIMLNVVAILGIIGNIISMIILSRPQMKSSINYLLIGLARCDTVLILTSIFLFGLPPIYDYTHTELLRTYNAKIYPCVTPYIFPLALTAQTVSVYLTLTVTLERFVAVCHPLRARSLCTYGRARLYVTLIIVFSFLYNLIRFWEANVVQETIMEDGQNSTIYLVVASPLRSNPLYISLYIHWLYLIFIYFLPFTSLAFLNAAIYRQVRRANRERQRLSRLQRKEIGLATMLLCVVVVFFLCNVLALVNNLLESFYEILIDELIKLSNLLVTINSSVNFVIYVIFGEKFKRLFLKIFCSHSIWTTFGGRESPDLMTHDDSLVSNGDGRSFSVRGNTNNSIHMCRLHRSSTGVIRNGPSGFKATGFNKGGAANSIRVPRALSPGPCVYYPAKGQALKSSEWETEITTSTSLSQL
uniref:Neuropeptide GPCR A40 n=1 Tax=Nilaparvata lugens TaxID=108931 RepID=U3U7P6_NILLU|nr:neuropeptide GPCR A40 [Nilaparvata lugens]